MRDFFRNSGLSIAMLGMFLTFLVGQIAAGRLDYNNEREQRHEPPVGYVRYLHSPHFIEATAENWESEFFQMGVYVFATAFLYQKGSAESKDPRKRHQPKASPATTPASPWPARKGGWILRIYEHSLSLAFFSFFILSMAAHAWGGWRLYDEEQIGDGKTPISLIGYITSSRFWFQSLQNWQSEFLAIGSMVLLSIWLREKNSPESKEAQTPYGENEED
jgi:hypothetical protein